MWLLTCLASTCGQQLSKDGEALWRVGQGSDFCHRAAHITSACVTVETAPARRKRFVAMKNTSIRQWMIPGFRIQRSRTPIFLVSERERLNIPHCHSEIAALQHLFDIDGSKTLNEWKACTKKVLTGKVNHFLLVRNRCRSGFTTRSMPHALTVQQGSEVSL